MKTPGEQRPIDVTTLPPRQDGPPRKDNPPPRDPSPRQPRRPREPRPHKPLRVGMRLPEGWLTNAALLPLGNWLWRPRTRLALLALATMMAIGVVVARFRPPTVDGPALATTGWKANASGMGMSRRRSADPGAALDGNPDTRWTTRHGQRNSDWFAVDMGKRQTFHQVVLDAGKNADEYPRAYAVYVSGDGVHWGVSVASGDGHGPITVVGFDPQTARYIKVVQTGQDRHAPWSLSEFTVH